MKLIRMTAVPQQRRAAFLRRFAAAADPSRQLRYSRRKRNGRIAVSIECDLDDLACFLRPFG
jgi:hypothetical protein